MSNPTFTSASNRARRLPAAFLTAILLIVAAEAYLYSNRGELIRDYWNKFLVNERHMIEVPDARAVVLGNSIQKTGLDPRLIGKDFVILGVPGAKPLSQEMALRRWLDSGKKPETLYLYVDPEDQHELMETTLRYYASVPDALRSWSDLTTGERWAFVSRYFMSLDLRAWSTVPNRPKYLYGNARFLGEMLEARGFMPSPNAARTLPSDFFDRPTPRGTQKFTFEERDLRYLGRIMDLTRERGIRVTFLSPVVPEGVVRDWERSGFLRDYRALRETVRRVYPEAAWEHPAVVTLGHEFFGDHTHLNDRGSREYSARFARLHAKAGNGK